MSDTKKNNKPDSEGTTQTSEGGKEKENILISKKESHKDNKCILKGIDKEREDEFNKMNSISVTQKEIIFIGTHRWLEVKYVS